MSRLDRKRRADEKRIQYSGVLLNLMNGLKIKYMQVGYSSRAATNDALLQLPNLCDRLCNLFPQESHLIRQGKNLLIKEIEDAKDKNRSRN